MMSKALEVGDAAYLAQLDEVFDQTSSLLRILLVQNGLRDPSCNPRTQGTHRLDIDRAALSSLAHKVLTQQLISLDGAIQSRFHDGELTSEFEGIDVHDVDRSR